MFQALAGRHADLVDQRARENVYLADTGQVVNVVFTTLAGSDVDVFSRGCHKDLSAFAAGPSVSDEDILICPSSETTMFFLKVFVMLYSLL